MWEINLGNNWTHRLSLALSCSKNPQLCYPLQLLQHAWIFQKTRVLNTEIRLRRVTPSAVASMSCCLRIEKGSPQLNSQPAFAITADVPMVQAVTLFQRSENGSSERSRLLGSLGRPAIITDTYCETNYDTTFSQNSLKYSF